MVPGPVEEEDDKEERPMEAAGSVERNDDEDAAADGESDRALETDPNGSAAEAEAVEGDVGGLRLSISPKRPSPLDFLAPSSVDELLARPGDGLAPNMDSLILPPTELDELDRIGDSDGR